MRVYLSILVGPRPDQAKPIMASDDATVVAAALRALLGRAGNIGLHTESDCEAVLSRVRGGVA